MDLVVWDFFSVTAPSSGYGHLLEITVRGSWIFRSAHLSGIRDLAIR